MSVDDKAHAADSFTGHRTVSPAMAGTAEEISPAECAELRRAAKRGTDFLVLANTYRISYGTVAKHVRGNCSHAVDEPPAPFE